MTPVICSQTVKRMVISALCSDAVIRWRRGRKWGEMPLNADRNRWGPAHAAEALHGPFALPRRLVAVLGPVVQSLVGAVLHRRHDLAVGGAVGTQLVGDDHPRRTAGPRNARTDSTGKAAPVTAPDPAGG